MKRNLVYDIGMNNGDDTAYYLSLGYKVIAVEAVPDLVDAATERFKFFIAETTARTAADLMGIHPNTAALFFHKLRSLIVDKM